MTISTKRLKPREKNNLKWQRQILNIYLIFIFLSWCIQNNSFWQGYISICLYRYV